MIPRIASILGLAVILACGAQAAQTNRKVLYVEVAPGTSLDAAANSADITATGFTAGAAWGSITGIPAPVSALSGTNTGDQTTVTGNAGTATTLATPRAINGVSFNGSADITVTAAAGTLTGNTLAGGVTGSSLTSFGAAANYTTTGNIGYATGAGGAVTQATSKSTGVTLNKICGTITLHNAALAAAAIVTFTVTNSTVAATDVPYVTHDTVGTIAGYTVIGNTSAAGSFKVSVRNNTAGSLSEAIVLRFAVIKAVVN